GPAGVERPTGLSKGALRRPAATQGREHMGSRRTVLRGGRLGGAAGSEVDRGGPVEPRRTVSYWCDARHESRPQFAADVEPPESWECHVCGQPAGIDKDAPPAPLRMAGASHKTPYEFLMMRRTP